VAGKSFALPTLRPVGAQALNIPLDPAVVQSWIDSPAANQGVMLVNNIPGEIVRIMSTVATAAQRPTLKRTVRPQRSCRCAGISQTSTFRGQHSRCDHLLQSLLHCRMVLRG
jgi:hypothetical protein